MKNLISILKRFNNFLKSYWLKNPSIGIRRILFFYLVILFVLCLGIISNERLLAMLSLLSIIGMTIYFFRQWRNFGYYHRLKEFEDLGGIIELRDYILPKNFSESKRELLVKNKEIFYTKVFLDCKRADSASYDYCRLFLDLFFPKGPKNSLILGGGGGAVPLIITKRYPKSEIKVVEISPKMISIAKKYFFLPKKIRFVNQSAFEFVKKTRRKYDFVFADVFIGTKLPKKFLDDRFLRSLINMVSNRGILLINAGEVQPALLSSGLKKFRKVFRNLHSLMIEKTIVFLVSNQHYTKEKLSRLSNQAKFKEDIERMIKTDWLEV